MIGITPAELRTRAKLKPRRTYKRYVTIGQEAEYKVLSLMRERGEITTFDVAHLFKCTQTPAKRMMGRMIAEGKITQTYRGGGHAKSRYAERIPVENI